MLDFPRTTHDFGLVEPGRSDLKCSFPFKNTGNSVVEILSLGNSCACLSVLAGKNLLEPGEDGSVEVTLHLDRTTGGPFTKYVFVYTTDQNAPVVKLTLTGTIRGRTFDELLTWYPRDIRVRKPAGPSEYVIELSLICPRGEEVRVLRSSFYANGNVDNSVAVRVVSGNIVSGRRKRILLRSAFPAKAARSFHGRIVIETDSAQFREVVIPARVEIVPRFYLRPTSVHFGILAPGEAATRRVSLESEDHSAEIIEAAVVDGSRDVVHVTISRKDYPNPTNELMVSIQPAQEGRYRWNIAVKTRAEGKVHELILPCYAIVSGLAQVSELAPILDPV